MAKVKAPLFSFDARGALAKAIVYSRWKGLQTIRQYVVPANPKTAGQVTQRGYFSDAVALYHDLTLDQSVTLVAAAVSDTNDSIGLARSARLDPMPMSGFNWIMKTLLDSYRRGDVVTDMFTNHCLAVGGAAAPEVRCQLGTAGLAGDLMLYWGYRPTFMPNAVTVGVDATVDAPRTGFYCSDAFAVVPTADAEVFCQFVYEPGAVRKWAGPICRFIGGQADDTPMV